MVYKQPLWGQWSSREKKERGNKMKGYGFNLYGIFAYQKKSETDVGKSSQWICGGQCVSFCMFDIFHNVKQLNNVQNKILILKHTQKSYFYKYVFVPTISTINMCSYIQTYVFIYKHKYIYNILAFFIIMPFKFWWNF